MSKVSNGWRTSRQEVREVGIVFVKGTGARRPGEDIIERGKGRGPRRGGSEKLREPIAAERTSHEGEK